MVCNLGLLILTVLFLDAILVLQFVVVFAIGVCVAVNVGMVNVIRDRAFKIVGIVFITITGFVVCLFFFVVVFNIGLFKVVRELIGDGEVLICVDGTVSCLCVADTDNVLTLVIVALFDALDLPVSLKGNDVLVETFFLLTVCDFVGKVVANVAITGDTITIDVKVFRFVIGCIVRSFFDGLVFHIGFVDVIVLLIVDPNRVNIFFVVFVFVPVDIMAVCVVCLGVFEINADSNGLVVVSWLSVGMAVGGVVFKFIVDTDLDGVIFKFIADTDLEGVVFLFIGDTYLDGVVLTFEVDTYFDDIVVEFIVDKDIDGVVFVLVDDTDIDGVVFVIVSDTDVDGVVFLLVVDTCLDDVVFEFIVDTDMDGVVFELIVDTCVVVVTKCACRVVEVISFVLVAVEVLCVMMFVSTNIDNGVIVLMF